MPHQRQAPNATQSPQDVRHKPIYLVVAWSLASAALLLWGAPSATAQPTQPAADRANASAEVVIEVFYRPDSELSTKALELLAEMERQQPGIRIKKYDVLEDRDALTRLWKLAKRRGVDQPSVPAYYAFGQIKFGFRDPETTRREIEDLYTIHAYTREGCPHCRDAKAFLKQLEQRRPGLRVAIHDVVNEAGARDRLTELSRQFRTAATGLPCFYAGGRFIVGFTSADTTGRQLESLFPAPKPEKRAAPTGKSSRRTGRPLAGALVLSIGGRWLLTAGNVLLTAPQVSSAAEGPAAREPAPSDAAPAVEVPAPPPESDSVPLPAGLEESVEESPELAPKEEIELPLLGPLRVRDWGLPGFTFLVGLIDGFNPCAMWVLVFLLSVLVNIRDRKKIIVIAGTFVLISGLAYFSFMAAWLNIFALIGWARPTQVALGLLASVIGAINVKDFVAFKRGISFSIPDSAKPGIYARVRKIVTAKYLTAALIGAAALAVLVNVIELLCTAGLPALYTQILTFQNLPAWKNYLYLALYNVAYMLDDAVMLVLTVVTLSHRRLQESEGRWLKLISGLVILALGLTMLFKPDWLQ